MTQPDVRRQKLTDLLSEGETFVYSNFASMSSNGYPQAYKPSYAAWRTRVDQFLFTTFGKDSPVYNAIKDSREIAVVGWGQDHFEQAHHLLIGALKAGLDALEFSEHALTAGSSVELTNRVFVVHGHDDALKTQVEVFLAGLGLEPIVLHRQPDEGLTVIEKIEKYRDVGYAFILLTPDDTALPAGQRSLPESERIYELRARQNVVFEFGYFVSALGRGRVCCIYKEGVTLPTDVAGMLYKPVVRDIEEAGYAIIRELKAAGFPVAI